MTATDYDFASTRTSILERAFRLVGALALGDSMSADQEAQGVQVMNAVVKSWQDRRTFLWSVQTFTQAFTAGVGIYNLPTSTVYAYVDVGYLRDSNNVDFPIQRVSTHEFNEISTKTDRGVPSCFTADATTFSVWPKPIDTSYTFVGQGVVKLKDWDTAGGTGEFPASWENALTFAVAADLAAEYGVSLGEQQALTTKAEAYFRIARNCPDDITDTCRVQGAYP